MIYGLFWSLNLSVIFLVRMVKKEVNINKKVQQFCFVMYATLILFQKKKVKMLLDYLIIFIDNLIKYAQVMQFKKQKPQDIPIWQQQVFEKYKHKWKIKWSKEIKSKDYQLWHNKCQKKRNCLNGDSKKIKIFRSKLAFMSDKLLLESLENIKNSFHLSGPMSMPPQDIAQLVYLDPSLSPDKPEENFIVSQMKPSSKGRSG